MADCPWDLNGDGVVDDADFEIFKLAYPSAIGDSNWNAACDFNSDGKVDNTDFVEFSGHYGPCPGVTPPPTAITCNSQTPRYPSGCELLLAVDGDKDGKVTEADFAAARQFGATEEELNFIVAAVEAGSINALCPGCYSETPPNMETRTMSLSEGQHTIQISLSGYDTLQATINVSSTGVTCVSVTGGACGGTGLPRVATSGWTVTTYLKTGAVAIGRCGWIATQDTSKVVFISEMVLAYNNLANIGFTPTAAEIGNAVLMYSNLGTPASLWGC